ncbi:hypothetical protein XU18_2688 [Perkinsela sp. CCAP 1560/4]|nr:hypothetical protein XU18_2688 [Perkinsela sp. CCAP 1560/4]|eukprot:KNH06484.1 hypothetical protein XU18_2688 [Perkinsela sp. CCAP 1560/4]
MNRGILKSTTLLRIWSGGNFPTVGDVQSQVVNYPSYVTSDVTSTDIAKTIPRVWRRGGRFDLVLRQDIYDELLKLPLRYDLHPFAKLQEQYKRSDCGYTVPLGPVCPDDPCPFHVHRFPNGRLPLKDRPLAQHNLVLRRVVLFNIDGDAFRLEEELIKIFPTKRTHVKPTNIHVWNLGLDGLTIIQYWLLGLGF